MLGLITGQIKPGEVAKAIENVVCNKDYKIFGSYNLVFIRNRHFSPILSTKNNYFFIFIY